jgi:hypothetical protein
MADQISPQFHAEIIVLLFDEHQDLRKDGEGRNSALGRIGGAHRSCWQVFAHGSDAAVSA